MSSADPHAGQPVLGQGPPPEEARLVVIVVHGRGDTAAGILGLAREIALPDVAYVAPQARGNTWYPHSFLAPFESNEPWLSSGIRTIGRVVGGLEARRIPAERIGILGFSQGACLSLEYVARHARRYAAVLGLSGGLIGPPGTPLEYTGSMAGTPVFLGCSDVDPHIPLERVHGTARVFTALGASVDERIYPGMGHTINEDELEAVRSILRA